jgi:hypothetical protein
MDRYVALLADAMHVDLDEPLVYVHGSPKDEPFCEALGCTFEDGRVFSLVLPLEHELVHGVRSAVGWSHNFWEEGTAEMFGGDSHFAGRAPAEGDLLDGIEVSSEGKRLPDQWYPRAGRFAAYLDRIPGVTEALLLGTDPRSTAREAIDVVEAATGRPFDELLVGFALEPTCTEAAEYRYPLFPCDAPEALRPRCEEGAAVRIEERIACDDPSTLGPRDGELWKYVAVDVAVEGDYAFRPASELDPAGWMEVRECAMGCGALMFAEPIRHTYDEPDAVFVEPVHLKAGRYALRLSRPADSPSAVSVWITGEDCR